MQFRTVLTSTLLHGAIVVGIGLGVNPWLARPSPPAQVAVMPAVPEFEVFEDAPFVEEVAPPETADAEVVDPEFTPLPAPSPDADAIDEPEADRDVPDPVYSTPQHTRASADLLVRLRPTVVQVEPLPATPAVAASFVEATELEAQNKPPDYPPAARRRGVEGDVILLVTVDVHGNVANIELIESAGVTSLQRQLDWAAIAAICKWRYAPAKRNGVPVEAKIRVPVEFRLR
jgi:periplasmic protein TonB